MSFLDFIVFFIYVFIFHIIFSIRRRRYNTPELKRYHKIGFWIKVFGTFAYCMFVLYLTSGGDSTYLYYPEGLNIYKLILKDPSNISLILNPGSEFDQALLADMANAGFFYEESNFMVTRIVAILCFFTGGQFMAINLIFSMISFSGVWRLYRFFYEQYPELHRQFAIAILYLPTFVFWSSGILKDPLCTGALGWITYLIYHFFYSKNKFFVNFLLLLLFSYLLITLKVYIMVSYLPFFLLFLVLKNVTLVKNRFAKGILVIAVITGSVLIFVNIAGQMQKALGAYAVKGLSQSILTYQNAYTSQANAVESNFSLGVEFDGSVVSLVKMAPAAIVATLFRPFIWESKKVSTLLSSIESLLLMCFTLFVLLRVGIIRSVATILKKPIVLYCFLYSIIFALFVGATTQNFGTLVRYKIPGTPFYVISLFLILYFNNKLGKKKLEKDDQTVAVDFSEAR
jgi:hypothetical protein